jgi:hypothetical protein
MAAKRSRTGPAGTQRRDRQASRRNQDAYSDLVAACQADLEEIAGLCADLGGTPTARRWGGSQRLAQAVARSLLGEDRPAASPIWDAIAEHIAWQRTELPSEDDADVDRQGTGGDGGPSMSAVSGGSAVESAGSTDAARLLPTDEAVEIVLRGTPMPRPEQGEATSTTSDADLGRSPAVTPTDRAAAGTVIGSGTGLDTWDAVSTRGDQSDPLDLGVAFVWLVVRIAALALLVVAAWLVWQEGNQAFAWLRR